MMEIGRTGTVSVATFVLPNRIRLDFFGFRLSLLPPGGALITFAADQRSRDSDGPDGSHFNYRRARMTFPMTGKRENDEPQCGIDIIF
jgi:hypothetical protein